MNFKGFLLSMLVFATAVVKPTNGDDLVLRRQALPPSSENAAASKPAHVAW
jgi:hypothetical protein